MKNDLILDKFHLNQGDYHIESYSPGECVIRQGDSVDYVKIIVSGSIDLPVQSSNGKILLNSYPLKNCSLGLMELLTSDRVYARSAIAVTKVKVAAIASSRAKYLLQNNRIFCFRMLEDMSWQMYRTSQDVLSATTRSAEERLCFYLLDNSEEDFYKLTITSAANATGVTYRHTMRLIKKLCEDQILIKETKGYRIHNRELLMKRALKSG